MCLLREGINYNFYLFYQVETLVKGVVDVYKNTLSDKEKECLVLPGVIYNSIIPRVIWH